MDRAEVQAVPGQEAGRRSAAGLVAEQTVLPCGIGLLLLSGQAQGRGAIRVERPAGVMLHMVLEGRVEATVAGLSLDLSRQPNTLPRVALTAVAEPAMSLRRACPAWPVKVLGLHLPWPWLAARGVTEETVLSGAAPRYESWLAGAEDLARAEALFSATAPAAVRLLRQEALSLSLAARALEVLEAADDRPRLARDRLLRMEARALRPGPLPSLPEIAAAGNMSVSSMQRVFRRAHDCAVRVWMRRARLERAAFDLSAGLSVAEAARKAGYATPEAFSTAFRDCMGQAPSRFAGRG